MFEVFKDVLSVAGIVLTALGALDVFYFIKPAKGIDPSNVINRVRLYWFTKKRPADSIPVYPWLKGDEGDNLK